MMDGFNFPAVSTPHIPDGSLATVRPIASGDDLRPRYARFSEGSSAKIPNRVSLLLRVVDCAAAPEAEGMKCGMVLWDHAASAPALELLLGRKVPVGELEGAVVELEQKLSEQPLLQARVAVERGYLVAADLAPAP